MNKLIIIVFCYFVIACDHLSRHGAQDTIHSTNGCEFDYSKRVEIERLNFNLASLWSKFSNCQAIRVSHDIERDRWDIDAMGMFSYNDVVGLSGAIGLHIDNDLGVLGLSWHKSPEAWMQWRTKLWVNQAKRTNARPVERKIDRIQQDGMDCWRIETKSYLRKNGTIDEYEQSNLGVHYICWGNDNDKYPPIELGAGISYRNGESLYPELDIDKDILNPVFNTLELKELTDQQYAAHVKTNVTKREKFCEGMLDSYDKGKRRGGAYLEHINSEGFQKNMEECGIENN